MAAMFIDTGSLKGIYIKRYKVNNFCDYHNNQEQNFSVLSFGDKSQSLFKWLRKYILKDITLGLIKQKIIDL